MLAARIGDPTAHPGVVAAPAVPPLRPVLIGGMVAASVGDIHACSMPPVAGPHPPSPFPKGSLTVMIGGRFALRMGDISGCGAPIVMGCPNVLIGG